MQTFPPLNLPPADVRIVASGQSSKIFDIIRKKYVLLTPEEWVRQHIIHFLITEKKFPASLLSVEKKLMVNGLTKRTDVVVYSKDGKPLMIVECKASDVLLNQKVFDQVARYNLSLNVEYVLLTNGIHHYCARMNHDEQKYFFLEEVPLYDQL